MKYEINPSLFVHQTAEFWGQTCLTYSSLWHHHLYRILLHMEEQTLVYIASRNPQALFFYLSSKTYVWVNTVSTIWSYLWSMWCPGIQWVTDDNLICLFYTAAHKLFINTFLHKNTWGSCAALTLVIKSTFLGFLHCQLHCGEINT